MFKIPYVHLHMFKMSYVHLHMCTHFGFCFLRPLFSLSPNNRSTLVGLEELMAVIGHQVTTGCMSYACRLHCPPPQSNSPQSTHSSLPSFPSRSSTPVMPEKERMITQSNRADCLRNPLSAPRKASDPLAFLKRVKTRPL